MGAGTVMGVAIFNHIEWNIKFELLMEVNFARFIPPPNIRGMEREFQVFTKWLLIGMPSELC